jgi:hypothetical protein
MDRLIYFGTNGQGPGHSSIVIKGRFSEKEQWDFSLLVDSERTHDFVEREFAFDRAPVLLHTGNYSIYAVPLSRDDNRGACITAIATDFDTRITADDFKAVIEKSKFLKRQFEL